MVLISIYVVIQNKIDDKRRSISFQKRKTIEEKKQEIIIKLWNLKTQKDWLELLMEDTTQIDAQIKSLQDEYKTLVI